jgi:hypothetical protein
LPDHFVSHYQLSKWLLRVMGADLINPNEQEGIHYQHGDKVYEDNLFRRVREQGKQLSFCDLSMVSRYPDTDACPG